MANLQTKIDILEKELGSIQNEYYKRIGHLYTLLDRLDLEIRFFDEIKELLESGLTYREARTQIFAENKDQHDPDQDKGNFPGWNIPKVAPLPHLDEDHKRAIKTLYRKLCQKYHPDLAKNVKEKLRNEAIMKKINQAYHDKNIDALESILELEIVEDMEKASVEFLKKKLSQFINRIYELKKMFSSLVQSEWYNWKIRKDKARKGNKDVFKELESKIKEEIDYRKAIIEDFRRTHEKIK